MIKVDVFSGFLGAGKTSLIKKLIKEAYQGENLVIIENEFGDIGIDGGFLKETGVQVNEMNSGCICCTLVGDFTEALSQVAKEYKPDRIIIEPSGVGKLSDVITAVENAKNKDFELNGFTTVVDATKAKLYMKNFGEFFNDQVENASTIILSRVDGLEHKEIEKCVELLREKNPVAAIVTTSWDKLDGKQILDKIEDKSTIKAELEYLKEENFYDGKEGDEAHERRRHHHEHCHTKKNSIVDRKGKGPEEEGKHCRHKDDEGCGVNEGRHSHHRHGEASQYEDKEHGNMHHSHHEEGSCCCSGEGHGHKHHKHEEEMQGCGCGCGGYDHLHEGHHHADEIFDSVGFETAHKYILGKLEEILNDEIEDERKYGIVLRCKGIVETKDGKWIHFDYVPGEVEIREGVPAPTGIVCVIGTGLKEDKLKELFAI